MNRLFRNSSSHRQARASQYDLHLIIVKPSTTERVSIALALKAAKELGGLVLVGPDGVRYRLEVMTNGQDAYEVSG